MNALVLMRLERERAELAETLRSETAQIFAGVLVRMASAARLEDAAAIRVALLALLPAVQADLVRLRSLATELRPSVLDDFGLTSAVRSLCRTAEEDAECSIELDWQPAGLRLSAFEETLVFRIVQEALQNARLHAAARRVEVSARETSGVHSISVQDDGHGFPTESIDEQSKSCTGIALMKAQAAALDGTLDIRSSSTTGTRVELQLVGKGAPT